MLCLESDVVVRDSTPGGGGGGGRACGGDEGA